jgi:hypothetical protein
VFAALDESDGAAPWLQTCRQEHAEDLPQPRYSGHQIGGLIDDDPFSRHAQAGSDAEMEGITGNAAL